MAETNWMNCKVVAVIAAGVALGVGGASIADDVPTYDLAPSCRAETVTTASDRSCMKDEQAARDMLVKQWSQFAPSDRATCRQVEETGGAPSYVELLTCLHIAAAAKKMPNSWRFGRKRARWRVAEDTSGASVENYIAWLALRHRDRAISNVQTHSGTAICCRCSLFESGHDLTWPNLMSQVLGAAR